MSLKKSTGNIKKKEIDLGNQVKMEKHQHVDGIRKVLMQCIRFIKNLPNVENWNLISLLMILLVLLKNLARIVVVYRPKILSEMD